MKRRNNTPREDYTLFQEIMETYRYPDGTLNKIAIFISTLALVLLLIISHFIITGIKNISKLDTVAASELSVDELQEYITNSYLDAIAEYGDGTIDQETAKRKILSMLSDYLESSNGFTSAQNEALKQVMTEYLEGSTVYTDIEKNADSIKTISSVINQKYNENQQYISQLKELIESEITANTNIDETRYQELNELLQKLQAYSDNRLADNTADLNKTIEDFRKTYENSLGAKDFSTNEIYSAGDYVIYNGKLYISLSDNNTANPEDPNYWRLADIEGIISNLERTTSEELDSLRENFKQQLETLNQSMNSQFNDMNESVSNQFNEMGQSVDNQFNEMSDSVNNQFSEMNESVNNQFNEMDQSVSNQFNEMNESVTNQFSEVNQSINSQGNDFQQQIDAINNRLSQYGKDFIFGYNQSTGAYGYYVNGTFKPFQFIKEQL